MRLLIATSGGVPSQAALRFGALLAKRATTKPTVLAVIKQESDRSRTDAILDAARELVVPEAGNVDTRVRVGHPAEEIVSEAEEGEYDVVVIGDKEHRGLVTRFFLGSTAVRVVEHAPCPVIIVKGKIAPVRRILVCDSGAPGSELLRRFCEQFRGLVRPDDEATVLHVMSQIEAGRGVDYHGLGADAARLIAEGTPEGKLLERSAGMLGRLCLRARPLVRHGLVVEEILSEASEGDYDLVVIGPHSGSGWRRVLLDDIAHEIVVRVDRPVLVVR